MREEVQATTYWFGTRYEAPTPHILRRWGKDAQLFFDIGANYGFFSFFMHGVRPDLPIHAFEPNPKTFSQSKRLTMSRKPGIFTCRAVSRGLR